MKRQFRWIVAAALTLTVAALVAVSVRSQSGQQTLQHGFERGKPCLDIGSTRLLAEKGKYCTGQRAEQSAPERAFAETGHAAKQKSDQQSDEPHGLAPRPRHMTESPRIFAHNPAKS